MNHGICLRVRSIAILAVIVVFVLQTFALAAPIQVPQAQPTGPRIWLGERQQLPMQAGGAPAGAAPLAGHAAIAPAGAQPLSLTTGDVDEDGIADLLVGYSGHISIQRGNLDAFAPQSDASFQAIGQGRFPAPFLAQSSTLATPVNPDFMAVGHFTGSGHNDLVVAAKGGTALVVFAGDGKGNFAAPQTVNLPGGVTAMLGGDLGRATGFTQLMVGINGHSGPELAIFSGSQDGVNPVAAFPLSGPASNLTFGDFGDNGNDLAFLAGGKVQILRAETMTLQPVSLPISAAALAVGTFMFDRNGGEQLAILGTDGSVQIAVRSEFDPRAYTVEEFQAIRQARRLDQPVPFAPVRSFPVNGWKIVESFPGVGAVTAGQTPVFFRTRIASNGADDVMWLGAGGGQMVVISHPDVAPGASTFLPGQVSVKPYAGTPIAGLAVRINIDGRPGVMSIHQGEAAPSMLMPLPDPTFFVNRTDDPVPGAIATTCNNVSSADTSTSCSLREAIRKANDPSNPGTDTISIPAGTFTLTQPRAASPQYNALTGTLNITDSVNIVGAGQNSTIIQAGTVAYNAGTPNGVDMLMAVNEDLPGFTNATASISNLTLQNGHNRGTVALQDGDAGCLEFDTGGTGTQTLTLTNVTIQNCDTTDGNGGGIAGFNTNGGTGLVTITNSIIQGNQAVQGGGTGTGGGLWAAAPSRMSLTGVQVLNNKTPSTNSTNQAGSGGGITITFNNVPPSRQTVIHSSTISGNQAAGEGGGIKNAANLLIDQGTVISNNSAGSASVAGKVDGGGLWTNTVSTDLVTVSHVTMTGNSAPHGHGGGILSGNASNTGGKVVVGFSRLAGNSAGVSGSNLENLGSPVVATTSADTGSGQDWWGTNAVSSTVHTTLGTTTFDPFIVLTHNATPAKIRINQSTTLTGDVSKDNHGTAVALANLDQIIGLPITFNNPVLGTIPQAQPETLNASAQATATFNAGGISGRGSANATVDQAVVGANSNLIASATEAGTTATITTVGVHNFAANETVVIAGVGVGGYNGTFAILSTPTPTTFTYTAGTAGLGASSGGSANVGIIILEPPQITKSFGAAFIPVNGTTTVNFSINNPNVVAINGSFTDTLPVGLQMAATPGVTNTCGGTVTAAAGGSSISFSNNLTPIGICTISVNITGTVDNVYTNSVQILSTDAGNGNTSSANITVINPPTIAKAFGAATIPLNGSTSLTFTLSSTNQNLTLNGVAFNDNFPAGLIVATPSNLSSTCSGTATAVDGSLSVSLSGATLAPNTSCTVSVNVQGTTAGVKNNSVQASSTNAGLGNTSNASITVVAPPVIIKAFGASSIPLNGSTSLTFTIQNNNATVALTGVGFSDTLPAGLVVSTPNGLTGTCGGGTITATQGTNVISLTGATLAQNTLCNFAVNVTGIAAGLQSNTTGNVTSTEGGTGGTATASVKVEAPPSIAKAFNPLTIAINATTSLTFTIANPAANVDALTGVAFTDTLPTGLVVSTPNGLSNTCGGTATAVAGSTSISLTGGSIAVNTNCTLVVNVTGTASGQYTNTTGAVSSTNGGTGNTASANLTVASPPSITKAFGAASIPLNGTTSLTFTINNPNTGVTLNGIAFTDNLPAGLVVATPNALNNTCGGTATAVAGSGSISLSAGTLAASASCTLSVNVTGTTGGVKNNSVQVTSTEGGTGNTSNASITVVGPPTIAKAFGAASVPLNGSTSLSFTITNPNTTTALTGVGFSDTLPAGLVISTPNGLTGSCGGGTITATAGTNVISLTGGSLAASASCTFSVNVTGTAAGLQNNTTGNVTSTEGGTGGTASASINVVAPPSIAKVFNPTTIPLNGTTTLTFTITNPAANTVAEAGVAFADTLPTGLVVSTPNGLSNTCGGTATAVAGSTSISLTGGSIAANTNCTLVVNVTGTASGQYTNTSGAVSSTNGGTGNTASANLTVATPASITKAFGAAQIPLNGTTSLTFTIQNPNTNLALTGLAFTDSLPAGLVVATPNALSNTCGGTATAVAGSGSISLSAGTLAASASCTVSVNVQGTTAGVKNNSVQVTSTEGGTGNTSNASITVVAAPTLTKAFGAASIPLNGSTSLSFTVTNPNTTATFTGVGFSDTLPAGLVISTPNGLTGSCGGGTITATQGTNVISLSGATLAANTSCTFSINVTGIAAGTQNNTTGAVTSTEGGTGGTASASINVVAPPSIAKVFNPSNIALNATTSLTFTITNPAANAVALTGVAFTDTLPTGLTVANASATVCGGTLTTTSPTGIALTGATIAANSQCQFAVTVTGAAAGQFTNTTGSVTSTNGGTGNTASANLTVATPPTITKAFGAASILVGANTSLTFSLNNPNASLALTGVGFSDTLPAGLQVATPSGLATTCSGTVTAAAGSGSISLTGGTLAASASCSLSLNVTGVAAGVQNNTTGPISSTESGAGATSNTASITVIGPPSIAKAFGAASINLNGTTTLTFTITNPNATVALTGVGFGDTLPAGLAVANPNGLTGSCGAGTITTGTVSGFSVVNLSGGTIAAGGSCTFSVNVVGTTGGHKVNTTGTVTSSNAGSGNQATATIDVNAPDLAITKTHTGTFTRGQTGAVWTITVSNVGFGPTVGTVTVVDTLPAVQNPPVPTALSGTGWTCTLATLTCTRADALTSGSYPPITLTVNIPKNIRNNFTNTATVSGGGDVNPTNNTATDSISLGPPIIMTPQSSSVNVVHGSSANMVINVDAPDPTLGVISFSCSGLPSASICNFSPGSIDPATTPGPTAMTVSVITTKGTASLSAPARPGAAGRNPLYAMLAFPVFGLVLAGFGTQGRKRVKIRSVLVVLGLLLLLAITGCGVAPPAPPPVPGTPAGTFAVTVTATSTGFTATTSFNLVVQ